MRDWGFGAQSSRNMFLLSGQRKSGMWERLYLKGGLNEKSATLQAVAVQTEPRLKYTGIIKRIC